MRKYAGKLKTFSLVFLSALSAQTVAAPILPLPSFHMTNKSYVPLRPRLTVGGNFGPVGFYDVDAMFPLYGNPDEIVYLDVYSKVHRKDNWLGSAGLGYRNIFANAIFGGYFFVDENNADPTHFTVLNPGFEFMSNFWDAHLNGYFVVSSREHTLRNRNDAFFTFHNQFLRTFDIVQETGDGADLTVGYTVEKLNRLRIFAGGYYFDISHNLVGVVGGIEIPIYRPEFQLAIQDSYDNFHRNTAVLSLRLTIGGLCKYCRPEIHDRMLDPIPRHLGALEEGSGMPVDNKIVNEQFFPVQNNLWFFDPNGVAFDPALGFGNCTFEHPCSLLNSSIAGWINSASPHPVFVFDSENNSVPGTFSFFHRFFFERPFIFGGDD